MVAEVQGEQVLAALRRDGVHSRVERLRLYPICLDDLRDQVVATTDA